MIKVKRSRFFGTCISGVILLLMVSVLFSRTWANEDDVNLVNDLMPLSGIQQVSAGSGHTCVVTTKGGVKCWGNNEYGQLGDGTTTNQLTPVDVAGLSNNVTAITAGLHHTCALTTSGVIKCWGRNLMGQLGNETTIDQSTPVDVIGLTSGVAAVTAGAYHTCALTAINGNVKCWGNNYSGELGDGTTTNQLTPVDVAGLNSDVTAIAAGSTHTCVVTNTGDAKCWGRNIYGQLGDGTITNQLTPVDVAGLNSDVTAIAAGSTHTCVVTNTGDAKCWGYNFYGQLGDGTTTDRLTPVDVSGLTNNIVDLSAGGHHTCALMSGGRVMCWGSNSRGELGSKTLVRQPTPTNAVGLPSGVTVIAAGLGHTCALTELSNVKCWGSNRSGQLGNGTVAYPSIPVYANGLSSGVAVVSSNRYNVCVVTTDATVKCWGNLYGTSPTPISGLSNDLTSVSVGSSHTCAITAQMTIQCWDSTQNPIIDNVAGLDNITAVTDGYYYTCALTAQGGVKCWGSNRSGQLGNGTTINQSTPVDVIGLTSGVAAVDAKLDYTCALTAQGGVKCWGSNTSGQLGNGTTINQSTPVDVIGLTNGVTAISVGFYHTCALTVQGGVKCWGRNQYRQLGDGTKVDKTTPVEVIGLTSKVTAIAAGGYYTCALTVLGDVKCWGFNNGVPSDVVGLSNDIAIISAGYEHNCAITAQGGVKCWGLNNYGQFGNGAAEINYFPVDVLVDNNHNPSAYTITGQVRNLNNQPVVNLVVEAQLVQMSASHQRMSPAIFTGTTDENGRYIIPNVPNGQYQVQVQEQKSAVVPSQYIGVSVQADTQEVNFLADTDDTPQPFLSLPVRLKADQTFHSVMKDTDDGGIISSWFDHDTTSNSLTLVDGHSHTQHEVTISGINCYRRSEGSTQKWCYDTHGAYDFDDDSSKLSSFDVFPAADGEIVSIPKTNCYDSEEDKDIHNAEDLGLGCGGGYGNSVYIYHEDQGYFTHYSHLERFSNAGLDVGQMVTTETRIGRIGNSGFSSGSHLDFEVLKDDGDGVLEASDSLDTRVDPLGWNGDRNGISDPWLAKNHPLWLDLQEEQEGIGTEGATVMTQSGDLTIEVADDTVDNLSVIDLSLSPTSGSSATLDSSYQPVQPFWVRLYRLIFGDQQVQAAGNLMVAQDPLKPITITVAYEGTDFTHLKESEMVVFNWNSTSQAWQPLATTVDTSNKQAVVTTSNLGEFYLQAPLVCPQDTYEPLNDHPANIKNVVLVAGIEQSHLFDVRGDQDWFVVEAVPNTEYSIGVAMNGGAVPQIEVHSDPDQLPIAVAIGSDVSWSPELEGIYFVKVTPTNESTVGCDSGYTLLLSSKSTEQAQNAVYLPLISR